MTLLTEAREALADGPLRAQVTGLLAVFEPAQERREALIDEALGAAPDEATRGWLYPAAVIVNWRPERAAQRAAAAEEVVRAAAQHADHGMLVWAYLHRIRDALEAGDIARADADLDRARAVALATRRTHTRWVMTVAEAGRAAFAGRLDEADDRTEEALAINRRHGDDCFQEHTVGRLVLARLRWRPHEADLTQLRGFAARYPHLPVWEAMLAALEWDLGERRCRPTRRRGLRARRLRRGRQLARLPVRRALPRRSDRGRGRAVAGRPPLRAAAPARGRQSGADVPVGRLGTRGARPGTAGRGRRSPRRRRRALR